MSRNRVGKEGKVTDLIWMGKRRFRLGLTQVPDLLLIVFGLLEFELIWSQLLVMMTHISNDDATKASQMTQ